VKRSTETESLVVFCEGTQLSTVHSNASSDMMNIHNIMNIHTTARSRGEQQPLTSDIATHSTLEILSIYNEQISRTFSDKVN